MRQMPCRSFVLRQGIFERNQGLLLFKAHAVGALIHSGIGLMGAHMDLAERTVVLIGAVMGALIDRTGNGLVCITATAHIFTPPSWW